MDIYNLSRNYWNFAFDNPDKIKPNHSALYFFAIEHCNRLGWKEKFGLPTTMVMEAIGIKSYNTYINTFNELVEFGMFVLHERSKNQYSSNIIALSNFNKANDKALDKALIKHATKQRESTQQSIDSIDIPINNLPINNNTIVYTASQSIELFNLNGLTGNFLSKMSHIHSLNILVVTDQLNKWIETNEDQNFKSEKHLQNSFNNWLRNYKPEKKAIPKKFESKIDWDEIKKEMS